jgi:hypothetical protein
MGNRAESFIVPGKVGKGVTNMANLGKTGSSIVKANQIKPAGLIEMDECNDQTWNGDVVYRLVRWLGNGYYEVILETTEYDLITIVKNHL